MEEQGSKGAGGQGIGVRRISVVNRVASALRDAGVLSGERLLVAVSGGVDSMVLLDVLARLQDSLCVQLHVAHVHHGLRGRAADQDAAFVVSEAARRGLSASVSRVNPERRRRGESVQSWARAARYGCLDAVAARVHASRIAVAHTLDDQAETVLLHLLRGTGPRGLAGIPPVRQRIVRPLLAVFRAEIEAYAAARRLSFRVDASNASDAYLRNRIRHHLLPLLAEEYNPRIVESLAALASLMREDDAALTAQAEQLLAKGARQAGGAVFLPVAALRGGVPAVCRRALQGLFQRASEGRHALTRRHLEALRCLLTRDAILRLPGGLEARRDGPEIRIEAAAGGASGTRTKARPRGSRLPGQTAGVIPVQPGVWTSWSPLGCRIQVRQLKAGSRVLRRSRWRETFSPRLLEASLTLRGWRPGDRFRPLGMSGEKKLQDFFVDAKVPRDQRGRIALLIADGRIAWVVGHRIAEEFRFQGNGPACLAEVEFPGEQRESRTEN